MAIKEDSNEDNTDSNEGENSETANNNVNNEYFKHRKKVLNGRVPGKKQEDNVNEPKKKYDIKTVKL